MNHQLRDGSPDVGHNLCDNGEDRSDPRSSRRSRAMLALSIIGGWRNRRARGDAVPDCY